jgi:hypothetical protein
MKGVLEILLLVNLIKGCPLKSKTQTKSIKKCYKTYSKSTIITLSSSRSSIMTTSYSRSSITTTVSTSDFSSFTDIITTSTSTTNPTTTSTSTTNPTSIIDNIPITSGKNATLTYFTDTVTQCYGGDIPTGNGLAINPLLLGFTLSDWNEKYANADSNSIPWCGKMMNITVNGKTYIGRIIDTCNPGDEGTFIDPNTGQIIGGKCDYINVIDLYGEAGLAFLQDTVGDDFYQGNLDWVIY